MKKKIFFLIVILFPVIQLLIFFRAETSSSQVSESEIYSSRVAVYQDDGVGYFSRTHVKKMLESFNYSYEVVNAKMIIQGILKKKRYQLLVIPGGESLEYLKSLGNVGAENIKKFIQDGGNYFGICAGAFYATKLRIGPSKDPIPYGIGLLDALAIDGYTLGYNDFKKGSIAVTTQFKQQTNSSEMLLLEGPSFEISEEEIIRKQIQIIGRMENGAPAILMFKYGKGNVVLSGPHPEIETSRSLMRVLYGAQKSNWPFLKEVMTEILN